MQVDKHYPFSRYNPFKHLVQFVADSHSTQFYGHLVHTVFLEYIPYGQAITHCSLYLNGQLATQNLLPYDSK